MIPALQQAATDTRLTDQDVRVLAVLVTQGELDTLQFRPLKEVALRRQLSCHRTTLYRSLTRLTDAGYLERTDTKPGESREYRLVYAVAVPQRTDAA